MSELPPDDYAAKADLERILNDMCARQWRSASEALIKVIPLCSAMTAEQALRKMADIFRHTAENVK